MQTITHLLQYLMPLSTTTSSELIDAAIQDRESVRALLPDPIDKATVMEILNVASRAPSGANIQPWQVYVLSGNSKTHLSEKVMAAYDAVTRDPSLAEHYV